MCLNVRGPGSNIESVATWIFPFEPCPARADPEIVMPRPSPHPAPRLSHTGSRRIAGRPGYSPTSTSPWGPNTAVGVVGPIGRKRDPPANSGRGRATRFGNRRADASGLDRRLPGPGAREQQHRDPVPTAGSPDWRRRRRGRVGDGERGACHGGPGVRRPLFRRPRALHGARGSGFRGAGSGCARRPRAPGPPARAPDRVALGGATGPLIPRRPPASVPGSSPSRRADERSRLRRP